MNKKQLIVIWGIAILVLIIGTCISGYGAEIEYSEKLTEEEHPIEEFLAKCMEQEGYTTVGMNNCTHKAEDMWETELNKYYKLLIGILDADGIKKLKASQDAWLKYRNLEFENIDHIYSHTLGTIYTNIRAGDTYEIVKQRALALKGYYNTLKENEEPVEHLK